MKQDGLTYTPYTFTYNHAVCPVNAADRVEGDDGIWRVFLGHFHVRAAFTQSGNLCDNVTYWTQRFITIDPVGAPVPVVRTFERRNGTLGTYSGGGARAMGSGLEGNDLLS